MDRNWLNFIKHDLDNGMTDDLLALGQSLNNQPESMDDEVHSEGDVDADVDAIEAETEPDIDLELDDDDDDDSESNVQRQIGIDIGSENSANVEGVNDVNDNVDVDDSVDVEVVVESDDTEYVGLSTDIDVEAIVIAGGEAESEIDAGNDIINLTAEQELLWTTEADINALAVADIGYDADIYVDACDDIDAYDNLRKYRMMGELIEIIDSMQAERSFCEFFNQRIIAYFAARKRYLKLRTIDGEKTRKEIKKCFADAISYLDHLIANDDKCMEILEICLEKFRNEREVHFNAALKSNKNYDSVMSMLTTGEPNTLLSESLHIELQKLGKLRARVLRLVHDFSNYEYSSADYPNKLREIKYALYKLSLFNPQQVASTNTLIINRMNLLIDLKERLNHELNILLNDLMYLHSAAELRDLAVSEPETTAEADEQYETAKGELRIELHIVPSPQEQQRLKRLAMTELSSQNNAADVNRERFNRWFRSIDLTQSNNMQNIQLD